MSNNRLMNSYAALIATIQGSRFVPPIDITSPTNHVWPYTVAVSKVNQTNNDYTTRKNTNVVVEASRAIITDVFLTDKFPPLYAKKMGDTIAYSDYPALAQFKQIHGMIGGITIEHLTFEIMLDRLEKKYHNNWEWITEHWLGGSSKYNHKMQQYEKFKGAIWDPTHLEKNVIKPEYRWYVDVPFCLFLNRDKFKPTLLDSLLEFQLSFNNFNVFISGPATYHPPELSGTVEMYVKVAHPTEHTRYMNNVPYLDITGELNVMKANGEPADPHRIHNITYVHFDKTYPLNLEMRLNMNPHPTHRLKMHVRNSIFMEGGREFFGYTVDSACKNWIASHIIPTTINTSIDHTINLSTGLFTNGNISSPMGWSIVNFDPTKQTMRLKYMHNTSVMYFVDVNCTVPFNQLKDIYFDLGCFSQDQRPSRPQFQYLKSFTLHVEEFNEADTTFNNAEDIHVQTTPTGAKKYVHGYFTFIGDANKKYVFKAITNVERSPWIDDFSFSFIFSNPVIQSNHTASIYASTEYVKLAHRFFKWYDLDKKYEIELDRLEITTINGQVISNDKIELMMSRDLTIPRTHFAPTMDLDYSYKDNKLNVDTLGFHIIQGTTNAFQYYTPHFLDKSITFNDIPITQVWKEYQNSNYTFNLASYQEISQFYAFDSNHIRPIDDVNREELNFEILDEILHKEVGWYVAQPQPNKNNRHKKRGIEDTYGYSNDSSDRSGAFNSRMVDDFSSLNDSLTPTNAINYAKRSRYNG